MPAFRLRLIRSLAVILLVSLGLPAAWATDAQVDARQTWQLLDYIAVDYAGAVRGGQVIEQGEFAEMQEFAATVRTQLSGLPPTAAQPALVAAAERLQAAVEARAEPAIIGAAAHALAADLLTAYPFEAAPTAPPSVAAAAGMYARQCGSCHGAQGRGDGPLATSLMPPPIAFTDAERAAQRTPLALYQVISQGLDGTAMRGFGTLPDADRWALAFYVGGLSQDDAARRRGEALWKDEPALHVAIPDLAALANSSEAQLSASLGTERAQALTAYLRSHPEAVLSATPVSKDAPLALARARLAESLRAFQAGDVAQARTLALSAYLDGVEPVEPVLAGRDRDLLRDIEASMARLREALASDAPVVEISAAVDDIGRQFDRAEAVLADSQTDTTAAFLGSFTILLREGLEALLIVVGMIAFLRKAERREVLPYVHAGWIGALLAGGLTWAAATHLVDISGANREVTEGLSALFAAAVLLSVGVWMHQKSLAGRWQQYLHAKMSAALTRRSALFLFSLAFVAVYREVFETILFFIAMWSEQASSAILAGLAVGSLVLAGVAVWMLRLSRRLPIAQFFSVSSLLIAVLAVVLVGKGIAALQEAGWVAQAVVAAPRIEWLGVYPSWQTMLAQVAVAGVAILGFLFNTRWSRVPTRASQE